jgi:phage terminase large subunit
MKTTKALLKIARLKKRVKIIQGGQGAGKTIAILILLCNHASSNADKEVFIASAELTKMRLTVIKDFVKVMKSFGIYDENRFIGGTLYRFPNGSFIKFLGLDKEDVGKGLRSDVVFINECNKVNFETYREMVSRAKSVMLDFNPNKEFWVHKELIGHDGVDFIQLTFQDNEYLSEEERLVILDYYEKGYNDDGTIKNKYWANKWQVYGLGNVGQIDGCVFEVFDIIDEIPSHAKPLGYGLDFGFTAPNAMVDVWEDETTFYVDEMLYRSNMLQDDLVDFIKSKCSPQKSLVCDSAEPDRIEMLKRKIGRVEAVKNKNIEFGLELCLNKKLAVTKNSTNFINELRGYTWEGKKDTDHLIDAFRYRIVQSKKNVNYGRYPVG